MLIMSLLIRHWLCTACLGVHIFWLYKPAATHKSIQECAMLLWVTLDK